MLIAQEPVRCRYLSSLQIMFVAEIMIVEEWRRNVGSFSRILLMELKILMRIPTEIVERIGISVVQS